MSNAPAGTPHASSDREFGKDRAADVGRGKQRGLEKDSVAQNTRKPKKNKKNDHGKSERTTAAAPATTESQTAR
jgi:hypothetical protein